MEMDYATKGIANAGLATGIIGTTLGVLGSGGLGGLFGGNAVNAAASAAPAAMEAWKSAIQAERERTDDKMRIATLESQKYSDNNDVETYKAVMASIADLRQSINDQRVINQQNADGILMARQEFKSGLELEEQKRKCGDSKIVLYANGTFVPKTLPSITTATTGTSGTDAVSLNSVTPVYAPLFNPLDS